MAQHVWPLAGLERKVLRSIDHLLAVLMKDAVFNDKVKARVTEELPAVRAAADGGKPWDCVPLHGFIRGQIQYSLHRGNYTTSADTSVGALDCWLIRQFFVYAVNHVRAQQWYDAALGTNGALAAANKVDEWRRHGHDSISTVVQLDLGWRTYIPMVGMEHKDDAHKALRANEVIQHMVTVARAYPSPEKAQALLDTVKAELADYFSAAPSEELVAVSTFRVINALGSRLREQLLRVFPIDSLRLWETYLKGCSVMESEFVGNVIRERQQKVQEFPPEVKFSVDAESFADACSYSSAFGLIFSKVFSDIFNASPNQGEVQMQFNIESKTFINGVEVGTLSDDQILQLIADAEADIKRMDAFENKPNVLVGRIYKGHAFIKGLVDILNERHPLKVATDESA